MVKFYFKTGKQKSRSVRFSERSDSSEGIIVHEVQSTGNLRRLQSWNSYLTENNTSGRRPPRNSNSDSSLSSSKINVTMAASSISPGKNQVFRVSPDQHLSGGSPDSDISTEFAMGRGVSSQYLVSVTQENYLQSEMKFVTKEIGKVRDILNDKVWFTSRYFEWQGMIYRYGTVDTCYFEEL